jgi:HAE1 family hydrophobic/amphiphilic exporter-1
MAVGGTEMIGIPYSPMGRTIIGGLLTSTIISLIAVPWAYTVFDDMRIYLKKLTALFMQTKAEQQVTSVK